MSSLCRQLLLTTVSTGVLVLAQTSNSFSDELVIDGDVTGTQNIDGAPYDVIVITGDGSITTTGDFENGVNSTIDGATITNNGDILTTGLYAFGIFNDGDDTTITNSGDIRTEGESAGGIRNRGDDVTITNSGDIRTYGNKAFGILNTGNDTLITNSGDIRTYDEYAIGIFNSVAANVKIDNSGDIRTHEYYADGIYNSGAYATITNSGDIVTEGLRAAGIYNNGYRAVIINSGSVRTSDDYAPGIFNDGGYNATITNSGDIRTEGYYSDGITNTGENSKITNSGDIRTSGDEAAGIYNDGDDARITNNGVIISERSSAIHGGSGSGGSTVTLNALSFLGGAITFEAETTLNLTTGASHSILWELPDTTVLAGGTPNVSGPVPWFYDSSTGQFTTYDPTGLTASFNQMANTANMLGRLGRYGLRQTGRGGPAVAPAALAYENGSGQSTESFDGLLATNSGPENAYGLKTGSFWLTGFGGQANHDGDDTTLDHTIDQIGAALGYAWNQSPGTRLGVMAGYMNGSITAESTWVDAQDIESNGVFAGVYGDRRFGRLLLGLGLAGGWQTNDSSRFINDNTALTGGLTLGESTADASYDSWFVTPEASLSADIALGGTGITLTPSVRGRYALQRTGSYTESGSNANATVDAHTFGVAEGDFELALSRSFQLVTLTGRAGYLVRSSASDDDVPVTLLGITNSVGLGATDRSAAYLGAALDLDLGPQASFTLDGRGTLSDDVDALEGMARFAIRF